MKKIFRMQFEPCLGACYAPGQEFFKEISSVYLERPKYFKQLMKKLLNIHEELCGNENLVYMIDQDDENHVYIASFWHYGQLDLFSDRCLFGVLDKLVKAALNYYTTEDYKKLKREKPGLGHDVCDHGEDHKLHSFVERCVNDCI